MPRRAYVLLLAIPAAIACKSAHDYTPDEACGNLAYERCTRLEQCSQTAVTTRFGDVTTCQTRTKAGCVAALAAPSTSQTAFQTELCAQAYLDWGCTDLLNDQNIPAACQPSPGGIADTQTCAFSGQCASDFCGILPAAACGTCGPPPAAGDPCTFTSCGPGLICAGDVQMCVAPAPQGAPCGKGLPCELGLSCVGADDVAGTQGVCQLAVTKAGAACDPTRTTGPGCDPTAGLSCDPQSKTCVNAQVSAPTTAADGAACDVAKGPTCLAPARCIIPSGGTSGTCQLASAASCQ
ncbi:MAG TPA: hypothetical protein VIF15_08905 [Polyangiaceae bacterium]